MFIRDCNNSTASAGEPNIGCRLTVRSLNRLGCAIEAMRAALNALAVAAPGWLRAQAGPAWADRYAKPADDYHVPLGEAARRACAEGVGRDGHALLAAVAAADAPAWLREVPAVMLLRRVWIQNFCLCRPKPFLEKVASRPSTPWCAGAPRSKVSRRRC